MLACELNIDLTDSMKFYQYPNCSTCRKASQFLKDNNVEFESIDITVTPPGKAELKTMLKCYQGEIRKLFNTAGLQYRQLKIKDRITNMGSDEAIELLSGNGKLIKRPFLLNGENGVVGFKEVDWHNFI